MDELTNITVPENAKAILRQDMIELKEVISIFPTLPENLTGYDLIPYSRNLLYRCSEPGNEYVLVPGLPNYGRNYKGLTVRELRHIFSSKFPDLFVLDPDLETPTSNAMDMLTCRPQWYLLSKKVIDEETIGSFCVRMGMDPKESWAPECSVVYVYAFLLFRLLRGEDIFQSDPDSEKRAFKCREAVSQMGISKLVLLEMKNRRINLQTWRPNPGRTPPGIVPSIRHYSL